jgi:hypothetical protein
MLPQRTGRRSPRLSRLKKIISRASPDAGGLVDAEKAVVEQFLKYLDKFTAEGKYYYEVQTGLKNFNGGPWASQWGRYGGSAPVEGGGVGP